MAISAGHKANFETLLKAVKNNDVALMECIDKTTGNHVYVICAVQPDSEELIQMIPLAKLFDGDPYEEVDPPPVSNA